MDTKVTSIVAYITWIGLIIAFVAGDKEGAKFHINQALVIMLFSLISYLAFLPIPFIGILTGIWSIFMMVCWILGLVAAIKQEEKEVPLIGKIRILK